MYFELLFFFGLICGAAATRFLFLFIFFKVEFILQRVVRRRETKAQHIIATQNNDEASMTKVQAICQMACYDNDIVGPIIPVRAVLFGKTISVYRIDSSYTKKDDKRLVITAEHLIGKIDADTVMSASERLSKYHRHTDKTMRHAPVWGTCLVLRRKEGLPLFVEDPVLQLFRQQHQQQQQQQRRGEKDGDERCHASCRSQHSTSCGGGRKDGSEDCSSDDGGYATASACGDGNNSGDKNHKNGNGGVHSDREMENEELFSAWSAVLFKLPTRRELERWFNLLQDTPQSEEWRVFINHLPCTDVFNLIVARLFFENTRTNSLHDLLAEKLHRKLRKMSKRLPRLMEGKILLDHLELGSEIPLIRSVGNPNVSPNGEVEFDFDLLYRGGLKLSLRFATRYRGIRVPDIIFNIKVLELSNRMRMSVGPPPTGKIWLGGPRPPQLRLEFAQEVASHDGLLHAALKLMPDMSKIVTYAVKVVLFEDMVLPSMDDFPLPCFSYSPASTEKDLSSDDSKCVDCLNLGEGETESFESAPTATSTATTTATNAIASFHSYAEESVVIETPPLPFTEGEQMEFLERPLDVETDGRTSSVESSGSSTLVPGSSVSEPWRRVKTSRSTGIMKWMKKKTKKLF